MPTGGARLLRALLRSRAERSIVWMNFVAEEKVMPAAREVVENQ